MGLQFWSIAQTIAPLEHDEEGTNNQTRMHEKSTPLTSNAVIPCKDDDEDDKLESSLTVSENAQNATQIDGDLNAVKSLKDDCNVSISIELKKESENIDSIEAESDRSARILTELKEEIAINDRMESDGVKICLESNQEYEKSVSIKTEQLNGVEKFYGSKTENEANISTELNEENEKNDLIRGKNDQTASIMTRSRLEAEIEDLSTCTELKEEAENIDVTKAKDVHNVVVEKEVKEAVGCESVESDILIKDNTEISDNIVLRKLLRGPRYFDPQDSGLGACYKCGEEGHMAVRCTMAKRKKPCFVCGSLDHNAKQCAKGNDCFICKKSGHRAKDCPKKKIDGPSSIAKLCLKCGQSGHDMFSCRSSYSSDDLKEIQCYICKNFGHLCCAKYTSTSGGKLSCYRCGRSGHTGLACKGLHLEINDVDSPSSCYRCGKAGHFARECTTSAKSSKRLRGGPNEIESPSSCYKCGEGGHFARECTDLAKTYTRMPGGSNTMEKPNTCYKCGQGGHFARECTDSAKTYTRMPGGSNEMESPSTCYKCGKGGHFARECTDSAKASTRLQGGLYDMESPTSCYRCGGRGHFARECTSSVEPYTRRHAYPDGSGSTSSCYNCGEGGHFVRDCTSSAKSLKRNRELSVPKYKRSKQKKDSFDGKSWHHDVTKARKRKKPQYEGEFSTPVKSKSRGWTTEHPGDLPKHKARNKGWKSPATPTSNYKELQKSNKGGYSSNFRSPRYSRKFPSHNSTSNNSYDGLSARNFRSA